MKLRKDILLLLTISIILYILYIFKIEVITYFSDKYQKKVCADTFCIDKPKGWYVAILTKNNRVYYLGYDFLNFYEQAKHNNTIFLMKKNKDIIIDATKTKKICKNRIKACIYTNSKKEQYKMICRIDNNIVHIGSESILDKNFLENIINSYEEIDKTKNNNPIEYIRSRFKCVE